MSVVLGSEGSLFILIESTGFLKSEIPNPKFDVNRIKVAGNEDRVNSIVIDDKQNHASISLFWMAKRDRSALFRKPSFFNKRER